MLKGIFALLEFLPMFIEFASKIKTWIENGVDKRDIEKALEDIDAIFQHSDPVERAKRLNDVFRKE